MQVVTNYDRNETKDFPAYIVVNNYELSDTRGSIMDENYLQIVFSRIGDNELTIEEIERLPIAELRAGKTIFFPAPKSVELVKRGKRTYYGCRIIDGRLYAIYTQW